MSGLAFSEIDDAVLLTQENLIKQGAFLDLQTDLSDHVFVREMWKEKKKKFDGGHPWQFQAQVDHNYSARAVGLYEDDGTSLTDTMIQGQVSARHVNAHYIYDQREPDFQRGGKAIVDLVKTRYVAMMVSFYEKLEDFLSSKPADDTDLKTPYGLTYWVLKYDDSDGSFYGQNPDGFDSGRAGIDSSTYGRWANWSASYTSVSKEDLIRKMRRGDRKSRFRSPISHAQPDLGAMKNGKYTNDPVLGYMEEVLEDQNMNLGNDLDSKGGMTLFKGTPVIYVPKLDDDTSNPVYSLDWQWFSVGVLSGWENNLTSPYMVPNKHTVRRTDLDCSLQMVCTNLRRQAVYYVA